MSNKVPQIRFNGYSDAWVQRKVSDLAEDTFGGGTPKTSVPEFWEGDLPWIQSSDLIQDDVLNEYSTKLISAEAVKSSAAKRIPGGSIAVVTRVGVGKLALVNTEYATSQDFLSLSDLTGDTKFTLYLLYRLLKNEAANAQGTSIKGITKADLLNKVISLPTNEYEQQNVGELFESLDKLIAANQRKLDLLKEQKKGYLQKMFPKNGAKVPELRFAGFADDWEERKLGELSNIVGGGTPSTSNPEYWDGDIDWYAPAEIGEQSYVSKSKKTITELGLKKSSARILPVGTVLFTSRAGIGNTAILAKEATTNQGFQSIVPDQNKLDSYFIFSRTNELKRYGKVTGAGSTFVEVSGKQMSKMSIMVPELSEQQKIGSFFKQLDETIALHQLMKSDSLI